VGNFLVPNWVILTSVVLSQYTGVKDDRRRIMTMTELFQSAAKTEKLKQKKISFFFVRKQARSR